MDRNLVASVLAHQFLELIEESGASFAEANAALKAAHALVQTLPLRIGSRPLDGEVSGGDL
jgi:hypothetical protein